MTTIKHTFNHFVAATLALFAFNLTWILAGRFVARQLGLTSEWSTVIGQIIAILPLVTRTPTAPAHRNVYGVVKV